MNRRRSRTWSAAFLVAGLAMVVAPSGAAAAKASHVVVVGTRVCKQRHPGDTARETAARRKCMRGVRESAKRKREVTKPRNTGPQQPITPPKPGPAEAAEMAHERWLKEGDTYLADFEGSGQCTEWAAKKRPDVIQRVYEAALAAELQGVAEPPPVGDAAEWPTSAAAVGFQISETPVQGALVVWQPGVEGAFAESGHVGYVESVSPDGSTFFTSEENFGGLFQMGYRELSTSPVEGRSFILP